MSRSLLPWAMLAVLSTGCYRGEWKLGNEVPVSSMARLMPVRDIERWEMVQSMTPHVLQIKGTLTQRCRYVKYGLSRRNDTGTFRRTGSGYWVALAVLTGTIGGAAAGYSLGALLPTLNEQWGPAVTYAGSGALIAGGLVSCVSTIFNFTKPRMALCGTLTGFGGAMLAGALTWKTFTDRLQLSPQSASTVQSAMLYGGASLVGVSFLSGLVSSAWRGEAERERTVDVVNQPVWDPQSGEQNCGAQIPISGRSAVLEITAEKLTDGLGSEAAPLRHRVAMAGKSVQTLDLRALRNAIPSCGALQLKLVPDFPYEAPPDDDFWPSLSPVELPGAPRIIHGTVTPREGLSLPEGPASGPRKPDLRRSPLPGIGYHVLATLDRRCRGEPPPEDGPSVGSPAARPAPVRRPAPPRRPPPPSDEPTEGDSSESTASAPVESSPATPPAPSLTPSRMPLAQTEVNECSAEAQQARFSDCEHQCGRALDMSACLFEFRKCHLAARSATQPQKERDACDLTWEQCLYKANVAPGSWRRCVESCTQANDPPACRNTR